MATATSAPSTVARVQAIAATLRLTISASMYGLLLKALAQLCSVKPCHSMFSLPFCWLKLKSAMVNNGMKRYSMASPATTYSVQVPHLRPARPEVLMPDPPFP